MEIVVSLVGFLVVGFLTIFYFAPGIPPHFEFVQFSLPKPFELEGPLAPNNILDKAHSIPLDTQIIGPESIAIRNSEVYTGLKDGRLVRIKNAKVTSIGAFGNCGIDRCPPILGVRFISNTTLLVCVASNGLFKVNVDNGYSQKLFSMETPIDGFVPRFMEDVDIDQAGNIYWSDASTISGVEEMAIEALAGPSGRLIVFDPSTSTNKVLISKLHMANGVQLSENEDFVLVAETFRARVWRYHLKGRLKGEIDIFVDKLPGLPDNIRPNGKGGFYITLAIARLPKEFNPLEFLGNFPLTRRFIVRLHYFLMKWIVQLGEIFPSLILKEWMRYMEGFGPAGDLENIPFKTIIIETDGYGKIIGSLQNEKGPMARLSQITIGEEWTYFGSPVLRELYRMRTSELRNETT